MLALSSVGGTPPLPAPVWETLDPPLPSDMFTGDGSPNIEKMPLYVLPIM